ncbi:MULTISPECIES: MFS transporter [unclassified Streptomyces]|uniref:MFS transporter n=1 Tax=unclassified Streptomyces TaxID=2593676 RepID=UPI002257B843|nr:MULTISPECIES: MFS transporter [unclassified Streptomyces]MCX5159187.1 MHS family MFS transporter [Streptomyces sp. NBC_00305]MCX5217710.1 MHS family MFS transporter [Streptomyces sp. NBC_00264]MCX5499503.1 MHS family MFS transporter [Streptomyces sp. NBC_00052]MCX5551962.1 MHS family MFS transporter [Streptomyces sp. NBC_00051]WSP50005.1 MHS family MFS transporter [Streptomyces sp. NBC_01243]
MNTSPHEEHSGGARATAGRTALATLAGTTLEWYDFFLYGTAAALIFNEQFFPSLSPAAGTLAAFSTFAVGFIARPLGGLVFGHYGDRIGRKATLVVSLVLMGIGSTLIGAIPSYGSIGFWAPVLLVTLRIVQGIGLGGEGAGATLMSMEHAPPGKKNLYAGFPQMGTPGGLVLANVIFLVTNAVMGDHAFTSWGWRIPFLLSFVLVAVGLVIRLRVTESPSFDRVRAQDQVVRFPLAESMKVGFPRLALTLLAVVANSAVAYVFMVFTLSYGSQHLDYDKQFLIVSVTVAAALWFVTIPVWTKIADRHGRRTMFIAGSAAILVWCVAFFPLINTGNAALAVVALLGMGLIIPVTHCVQGSIIVDTFPVNVRYSGSSVILQGGAILGGGLAPMISTALLNSGGSSTGVTWYLVGICAVSLAGAVALFRLVPEGAPEPVRDAPAKALSGRGA